MNKFELLAMLRHNAEWDIGGMTFLNFGPNKPAILAAINALMERPKSRKRFRLLAVYDRETGELLAEVFGITVRWSCSAPAVSITAPKVPSLCDKTAAAQIWQ